MDKSIRVNPAQCVCYIIAGASVGAALCATLVSKPAPNFSFMKPFMLAIEVFVLGCVCAAPFLQGKVDHLFIRTDTKPSLFPLALIPIWLSIIGFQLSIMVRYPERWQQSIGNLSPMLLGLSAVMVLLASRTFASSSRTLG